MRPRSPCATGASLFVLIAFAANQAQADDSAKHVAAEAPRATPPEIRATVDAFAGAWLFDATVTMPDGKAVKRRSG